MEKKTQDFEEQYQELLIEELTDENKRIGILTILWVVILLIILISSTITIYNYKLKELDRENNLIIEEQYGLIIIFKNSNSLNTNNKKIDIVIENIGTKDLNYELEFINYSVNIYNELKISVFLNEANVKNLLLPLNEYKIYKNTIKQNSTEILTVSINDYPFNEEEFFETNLKINILK